MVKVVMFDFDGVIADSWDLVLEIAVTFLKEKGREMPDIDCKSVTTKEVFDTMGLKKTEMPFYLSRARKIFFEELEKVKVFPDIPEVLNELSKDYKLVILSTNIEKIITKFLETHNLSNYFDEMKCGASVFGKEKRINKFVKDLGVEKKDVLYIGDEVRDIDACKKSGVKILAVGWGYKTSDLLKKHDPDYLAETPQEMLKIIRSLK